MKERLKLLWLASWYPGKISAFNGDFIKRHAEAVSLFADVQVVHFAKDGNGAITHSIKIEESHKGSLKETIIYYYSPGIGIASRFFAEIKFRKIAKGFIDKIIVTEKPDIVHVHVGMKCGLIADWVKKKFKIPYVVTEHWTGLPEESIDNFSSLPAIRRSQWKRILKNADAVTAVSQYLAAALKKRFAIEPVVIPNVVDTGIFYPEQVKQNADPNFIFISTFDDFKNPDMVLKAFAGILAKARNARLTIFAPDKLVAVKRCAELGIEKNVYCSGEVPQTELAKFIKQSDALLLYSSYETFGCVVIEANAAGVPVLVSNIPAMRELVTDRVNGLLINPASVQQLTEAMIAFSGIRESFDKEKIAEVTAEKFNYKIVGKQFVDLYQQLINKARC